MAEITAMQEAMIALYKEGKLVAIVKQNGHSEHFKVEEMSNADFCELYEANQMKHELTN